MLQSLSARRVALGLSLVLIPIIAFTSGCPLNFTANVPSDLVPCDNGSGGGDGGNGNDNGNDGGGAKIDTTYSGQATVFRATIGGNQTVLVDTGALPAAGGVFDTSGLTVDVPNILSAEIGHATSFAGNGVAQSEAALANVDLTIGTHKVQADFLMARATAKCSAPENGSASVQGVLIASNLRIDNQVTTVTAAPNQEIVVRDGAGQTVGRVVLNEQVSSANGAAGDISVNGLRFEVTNVATVVLFAAHADVNCATNKVGDDFVTGGGLFDGAFGHIYFAVAGGSVAGGFRGHFALKDTGTSMRVIGTGVTAYTVVDATTRHIEGTCQIDGVDGFTYAVDVTDAGEPGTADKFTVQLSNGYHASTGSLIAGNIQLHTNDGQ
jgi:hypothetical protein